MPPTARFAALLAGAAVGAAAGALAGRLRPVAVSGPSMTPTLHDGDAVLALAGAPVRPGHLVIARFPAGPDLLVVKRAVRPVPGGWWIEGDNPYITDDSRRYGTAEVLARVLFRYGSTDLRSGVARSARPGDPMDR